MEREMAVDNDPSWRVKKSNWIFPFFVVCYVGIIELLIGHNILLIKGIIELL